MICNGKDMDKGLKIRDWILGLPQVGRLTFSIEDIHNQFPDRNKNTIRNILMRLIENGKLQSVWRGFYVVVPVEYELKGYLKNYIPHDTYIKVITRD